MVASWFGRALLWLLAGLPLLSLLPILPGPTLPGGWALRVADYADGVLFGALLSVVKWWGLLGILATAVLARVMRRTKPVWTRNLVSSLLIWLIVFLYGGVVYEAMFGYNFPTAYCYRYSIRRAQPVLDSLVRYRKQHGRYPNCLSEIYPNAADIPTPGTFGADKFEYHTVQRNRYFPTAADEAAALRAAPQALLRVLPDSLPVQFALGFGYSYNPATHPLGHEVGVFFESQFTAPLDYYRTSGGNESSVSPAGVPGWHISENSIPLPPPPPEWLKKYRPPCAALQP